MPKKVVFIGSRPTQSAIDSIKVLLSAPDNRLGNEVDFTGRPATEVYADQQWVVKIHSEWKTSRLNAERWLEQQQHKQRSLAIYPQQKFWFMLNRDELFVPGNICQRLTPLHRLMDDLTIADEQKMHWLSNLIEMYFDVWTKHQRRLDEGLSNFCIDDDNRLYYVDDDSYELDGLLGFSQAIGVYIRSQDWLKAQHATMLGELIAKQFGAVLNDSNLCYSMHQQLDDVYIPEQKQTIIQPLKEALAPGQNELSPVMRFDEPLAIIADIHANLHALEAVLDDIKANNIAHILVLGDIVGYGPEPAACIERIRDLGNCTVIIGNHDYAQLRKLAPENFSRTAKWSYEWTAPRLEPQHIEWLESLVPFIKTEQLMAVHGAPVDPTFFNAYVYNMTYEKNLDYLQDNNIRLCVHGHTHMPGAYYQEKKSAFRNHTQGQELDLSQYAHLLVCPGSVGQPRDGSKAASYAVLDNNTMRWRTVDYDYQAFMQSMTELEFPDYLMKLYQR